MLQFRWSPDGTALPIARSTEPVAAGPGKRLAVRAVLDVSNGAGGWTMRFYVAEHIGGPWSLLGEPVTGSGVTAIFAGTAPLEVGDIGSVGFASAEREIWAFELRNGIDGPLVAAPDFTVQASGAASFTDAAGVLWQVENQARISDRHIRFAVEISEWPPRWTPSGADVWVPIEAAGVLRRMGQGAKALDSTLRRRIPSYQPLAYWPMEDGREATQASSPIAGLSPLRLTRANWAAVDSLPSSGALPTLASNSGSLPMMDGRVPASSGSLSGWSVQFVYRLDSVPADLRTFLRIRSTGTVAEWYLQQQNNGARILGRNDDGGTVVSQDIGTTNDLFNQWMRVEFRVTQSGSTVEWVIRWTDVGGDAGSFSGTFTGTIGRPTAVASPPDGYSPLLDGMAIGHISVWPTATTAAYDGAIDAWTGESAINRMVLLSAEESVALALAGDQASSEAVGAQLPAALLDLLAEAAEADGGILYEDRTRAALRYRARTTLYNQSPALALAYAGEVAPPLEPVDDDQHVRNDVTVSRSGGSSARVVKESGPLSIQAPPAGVGRYDEALTLSLAHDHQAEPIAAWRVHLGTVDEARHPTVRIRLHKAPHLIPAVLALGIGDKIRITDLPPWLPPGPVDLIVTGYSETFGIRTWDIEFTCNPAGPWTVGVTDDVLLGRVDTDGSHLAAALDQAAASVPVHTEDASWVTAGGEFPFDVRFGGEVATVTGITNTADTFTRTLANTWGTASSGETWAEVSGAASDRSVDGTRGIITLAAAPSTLRFQTLTGPIGDCEVRVRMAVSQVATGASRVPAVLLRYADQSTYYRARIHFATGGGMFASITRDTTQIGGTPQLPYSYTAGAQFELRVKLTGQLIQMRVWPTGTAEPTLWHHAETIVTNPIGSGAVGLSASAFAGMTNLNPQLFYDEFALVTPQRFTLARSVNGIVKAHAAGTDLRLAQPAIVAL
ncbi:hypothetical protein AB0H77_14625 [Streptomyces sp. NPDC050844]|uniref:hypothetical protein n=1 Tax=Streptomyces sp. NPDC050844 TaxID=3155790 RepID=UPI00340C6F4E